jgi:peptidyl-prolyl cis-trans isomerase C
MGLKFYLNVGLQCVLAVVIILCLRSNTPTAQITAWQTAGQKMLAAGLWRSAAQAYEKYLGKAPDPGVAYSLAEIYTAHHDEETALTWLYFADAVLPTSNLAKNEREDLRIKINQQLVALLEKNGKSASARQALAARTSLDKETSPSNAKVIAEVGNQKIYDYQLDERLNEIAQVLGDKNLPDKKMVAQDLVTMELFWQKALRLGLDRDPKIQAKAAAATKAVALEKMIKDELKQKVMITESDLKNFYQAHQNDYKDPKTKKVLPYNKVKAAVQAAYQQEKSQEVMTMLAQELAKDTPVKMYPENIP